MTDDLAERLRRAYPTGLFGELDQAALVSEERDRRLQEALTETVRECSLSMSVEPFDKPAYEITLTQKEHPPFDVWIWQMRNPQKLAWIKANGGPYPAFWLKVSRVADHYYFFYNHWVPRGDTGYLDADFRLQPNPLWVGYEAQIRHALETRGFAFETDALARERTPLVLVHDWDAIPENDPRWDDDSFEPPLVPASVDACLFGDH